jgi:hypothetical protein
MTARLIFSNLASLSSLQDGLQSYPGSHSRVDLKKKEVRTLTLKDWIGASDDVEPVMTCQLILGDASSRGDQDKGLLHRYNCKSEASMAETSASRFPVVF